MMRLVKLYVIHTQKIRNIRLYYAVVIIIITIIVLALFALQASNKMDIVYWNVYNS